MSNRTMIANDTTSFGARMNDANSRFINVYSDALSLLWEGKS